MVSYCPVLAAEKSTEPVMPRATAGRRKLPCSADPDIAGDVGIVRLELVAASAFVQNNTIGCEQ
jgi:hypothetical protein